MTAELTFKIDGNALALVIDQDEKRPIGTAFVFIQPYWAVTAKHVVIKQGVARVNLQLLFRDRSGVPATILYVHPSLDLAVLLVPESPCKIPLFPGHHTFSGSNGLVVAGYKPSQNTLQGLTVEVNRITSFSMECRERIDGTEDLVVFDSSFAESGHSGGPVFGSGGGVVGVVIQQFTGDGGPRARATAIGPLLSQLVFRD